MRTLRDRNDPAGNPHLVAHAQEVAGPAGLCDSLGEIQGIRRAPAVVLHCTGRAPGRCWRAPATCLGIILTPVLLDMASYLCHNDAMDLSPYVENLQRQLAVAANAGGDDARALAERLVAPLDAAVRLMLLDALVAAAEEITTDLAPGSVQLRLRGRDPEFVVTAAVAAVDLSEGDDETLSWPAAGIAPLDGDDGAMSRINLRMPDRLKARVEQVAAGERLSVNAWLVRAAAAGLERASTDRRRTPRAPQGAQRYTGWAR
jgi:hypothetical protein